MNKAYGLAQKEMAKCLQSGGECLDCGANNGRMYDYLEKEIGLGKEYYYGIEWNKKNVEQARNRGLDIMQGDLNKDMLYPDGKFTCVFGLSLLEHLLNPCRYLNECHRVLRKGGKLIILTPNISTYFTAALIMLGKMPSSGPHPDSDRLIKKEEIFKVSHESLQPDTETDTPVARHLIVFSYRVLRDYLKMVGFQEVRGYGFGVYPFPNIVQPVLEKIDPFHCHQMVFISKK